MDIKAKFSKLTLLAALFAVFSLTSCESVFDDEGDCSTHYLLKFKYDMNMKFADAFANNVNHVEVFVYDINTGNLVLKQVESGAALQNEDYRMELEGLKPGTYDIIAWCGDGLQAGNFDLGSDANIDDINCTMDRDVNTPKSVVGMVAGTVSKDVGQLYHGYGRVEFAETYGTYERTLKLVKNTNQVRIILQHLSGIDVNPDDFEFTIEDNNGLLAPDNSVVQDMPIVYFPWSVTAGKAGIDADIYPPVAPELQPKSQTSVSVALAEFTVNRLVMENDPILSIYNVRENHKLILAIPLKDYALLVKGNYNRNMDDQEYLDRQDEYNLTFFLDEYGNWASSRIIINSWALVLNSNTLK